MIVRVRDVDVAGRVEADTARGVETCVCSCEGAHVAGRRDLADGVVERVGDVDGACRIAGHSARRVEAGVGSHEGADVAGRRDLADDVVPRVGNVHVAGCVAGHGARIAEARVGAAAVDVVLLADGAGQDPDDTGRRDLADHVVPCIRDVDIADRVAGDTSRRIEAGGRSHDRRHIARRADLPHRVVGGVRDVDVADRVAGDTTGSVEARRGAHAVRTADDVGGSGERRHRSALRPGRRQYSRPDEQHEQQRRPRRRHPAGEHPSRHASHTATPLARCCRRSRRAPPQRKGGRGGAGPAGLAPSMYRQECPGA